MRDLDKRISAVERQRERAALGSDLQPALVAAAQRGELEEFVREVEQRVGRRVPPRMIASAKKTARAIEADIRAMERTVPGPPGEAHKPLPASWFRNQWPRSDADDPR